jgi:hypothetical protein
MDKVTYDIPLPNEALILEVQEALTWYGGLRVVEAIHSDELRAIRRKLSAAQFMLAPELGRARYLKEASRFHARRQRSRLFREYRETSRTDKMAYELAQINVEDEEQARAVYTGAYDTLTALMDSIDSAIYSIGDDLRKLEKEMSYDKFLNDLPATGRYKKNSHAG